MQHYSKSSVSSNDVKSQVSIGRVTVIRILLTLQESEGGEKQTNYTVCKSKPSSAIKNTSIMASLPYSLTVFLIQEVIQQAEKFKPKTLHRKCDKGNHFLLCCHFACFTIQTGINWSTFERKPLMVKL